LRRLSSIAAARWFYKNRKAKDHEEEKEEKQHKEKKQGVK
jgi:hypothetical protein